jgi:phosphinothricin acetyltransferase
MRLRLATLDDAEAIRAIYAGVGKRLLTELVSTATAHGFHACMARIVGGHEASIALHHACGFEVVGTEHEVGRKFGTWLDVVLMERMLA